MDSPITVVQTALACGCGSPELFRGDLCRRCYRRRALNRANFAGLRELVLLRDEFQCQLCGALDGVLVHHRRRRVRRLADLVTLCRGCHARVHHTAVLPWHVDGLLRALWAEVGPEQLRLALAGVHAGAVQIELFAAAPLGDAQAAGTTRRVQPVYFFDPTGDARGVLV